MFSNYMMEVCLRQSSAYDLVSIMYSKQIFLFCLSKGEISKTTTYNFLDYGD